MKSVLYAVLNNESVKWDVSLSIQADMTYWFGRYSDSVTIRMLEPAISFGQAVVLRDRLNSLNWKGKMAQLPDAFLRVVKEHAAMLKISVLAGNAGRVLQMLDCTQGQWDTYRQAHGESVLLQSKELDRFVRLMQGRCLLMDEVGQLLEHDSFAEASANLLAYMQMAYLHGFVQLAPGIELQWERKFPWIHRIRSYRCRRCGSGAKHMVVTECMYCGMECPYCEECLTMGRARFCSVTVRSITASVAGTAPVSTRDTAASLEAYIAPWGLSEIQAEASGQALQFLKGNELHKAHKHPSRFLIWAVTGAGKTEMIFPMIHYTIAHGGKVVVATPRRDVVLELKPRLEKAFHPTPVVTLYGGSEQRWETAPITIATTHQLMRFERAFDLVIIDELDALPYETIFT